MAEKKKNDDGIDYNDVKRYAKITGVNVVGKKKAVAVGMVLDAIVAHYERAKEEITSTEEFEAYKVENDDMLKWFNYHKEFAAEPDTGGEPGRQEGTEPEGGQEEATERQEPEKDQQESEKEKDLGDSPAGKTEEEFKEVGKGVEAQAEKKNAKGKAKDLAKTKDRIKDAKAKAGEKKAEAKVSGESSAAYIPRYRKMMENPDSIPSKIREYIKEKGEVPYDALRKECVKKLGCKSEMAGTIGASVKILKMDGLVRIEGKGSSKRIIAI